jgi:hypothetical protein
MATITPRTDWASAGPDADTSSPRIRDNGPAHVALLGFGPRQNPLTNRPGRVRLT